jgi:hypothetical protein
MPLIDSWPYLVVSHFCVPVSAVEGAIQRIFKDEFSIGEYSITHGSLDLGRVRIGQPSASGREMKKIVVFAPNMVRDQCAFVANIRDGWYTLTNVICKELRCSCVQLSTSTDEEEFPSNMLHFYENGSEVRVVYSMLDDDRWVFFERGPVQSCENKENYKRRRIKDRLNRAIIVEYAHKLGLPIDDDRYWRAEGSCLYLEQNFFGAS